MTGVSVFQYSLLNSAAVKSAAFLLATNLSGSKCGTSSGSVDGMHALMKGSSVHAQTLPITECLPIAVCSIVSMPMQKLLVQSSSTDLYRDAMLDLSGRRVCKFSGPQQVHSHKSQPAPLITHSGG